MTKTIFEEMGGTCLLTRCLMSADCITDFSTFMLCISTCQKDRSCQLGSRLMMGFPGSILLTSSDIVQQCHCIDHILPEGKSLFQILYISDSCHIQTMLDSMQAEHTRAFLLPDPTHIHLKFRMRVQLIGGILLHQGRIPEMRTGEGKTLVSTLPAYLNALEGKGVHIVTVNDYLAKRDAEWMGQVHEFLGLTVGVILNSDKNDARRAVASV